MNILTLIFYISAMWAFVFWVLTNTLSGKEASIALKVVLVTMH